MEVFGLELCEDDRLLVDWLADDISVLTVVVVVGYIQSVDAMMNI